METVTDLEKSQQPSAGVPSAPEITIDEHKGFIQVRDPRLFHAGRRAFCGRVVEAATRESGVSRAQVDLGSSVFRLNFSATPIGPEAMAKAFVTAVQAASASPTPAEMPWWGRTSRWSSLTAFRPSGELSLWETLEVRPGQLRVRHRGSRDDRARFAKLASRAAHIKGVRYSSIFHRLDVDLRAGNPTGEGVVDTLERALEELRGLGTDPLTPAVAGRNPLSRTMETVAGALERLRYLVLAAGCFGLTIVALTIPGVPTLPFLVATSYYLGRSSPWLNRKLMHTAFFGPILQEWEQHRGLSRRSKGKLIGFSLTVLVITLAVTSLSPVAWVLVVLFMSISTYQIVRMPGIPGQADGFHRPTPLALPAT